MIKTTGSNCQNSITSFWAVAFSTYGNVCLEFFRTVTSETILKKKATVQFPKHERNIFISCLH